jgi:hypothetical protein
MRSPTIAIIALVAYFSIMVLSGCRSRVEEAFILTNDGHSKDVVSDCFVKIVSPPGRLPSEYNKKDIVLVFRDANHKLMLTKKIAVWGSEIKPSIDWTTFPEVRISLKGDGHEAIYSVIVR